MTTHTSLTSGSDTVPLTRCRALTLDSGQGDVITSIPLEGSQVFSSLQLHAENTGKSTLLRANRNIILLGISTPFKLVQPQLIGADEASPFLIRISFASDSYRIGKDGVFGNLA